MFSTPVSAISSTAGAAPVKSNQAGDTLKRQASSR